VLASFTLFAGSGAWVWAILSHRAMWTGSYSITHQGKMAAALICQHDISPSAAPSADLSCSSVLANKAACTYANTFNCREFMLAPTDGANGVIASRSPIPNRVAAKRTLNTLLPVSSFRVFASIADIASVDAYL